MNTSKKVLIIIPSYNEERSVGWVIQGLNAFIPEADIVVIDDGSRDRTASIAKRCKAWVISLPYNLGIGGAVQTGYKFAHTMGYDIAIQVDGDGQHSPQEVRNLINEINKGDCDMVIGSRFVKKSGYRGSFPRRVGALIFSIVVSIICRQKFKDTTSGFRAVNRKVIEFFASEYPHDYPEAEAIVSLRREGFKVKEIPTEMEPRLAGVSSIDFFSAIYYMAKVLLAVIIAPHKKKFLQKKENGEWQGHKYLL
jgi:hypothetical protein